MFAKRGASAARAFCRERFLSRDALERVAEVREQLRSLLRTAGFARREPSAGSAASSSALDVEVFRAVACAGLFPKIAAVSRRGRRVELRTHEDGRVEFHPGSVNAQPGASFPFPWVAYGEKVKTGAVYLRDSTCVPACAVLLLGGELEAAPLERDAENEKTKTSDERVRADDRTREDQTLDRVRVLNGAYAFVAPSATLDAIKRLRNALDATLREKVENPAVDVAARGAALVGAVRALMADEARASAREAVARSNPGEWPCPRGCGVVFAAKKRCFRCGVAKPEAAET